MLRGEFAIRPVASDFCEVVAMPRGLAGHGVLKRKCVGPHAMSVGKVFMFDRFGFEPVRFPHRRLFDVSAGSPERAYAVV